MGKTLDEKIITEEQLAQDDARFKEISAKEEKDRTADEVKEFGELKERYGKRMQKKIDSLNYKAKTAEEEAQRERERSEKLERELEEIRKKDEARLDTVTDEFIEVDGKKFLTNKALKARIDRGDISEDEAYAYEKKRDKAEFKAELRAEQEQEGQKRELLRLRADDVAQVKREYPHFSKDHPDFDPNDPLYKLATELWSEGYAANPQGMSKAIKRAKEILRLDKTIDRADDFSMELSDSPPVRRNEKQITLSDEEKEAAIRIYRDQVNPKTQQVYTEREVLEKALQAKKRRMK